MKRRIAVLVLVVYMIAFFGVLTSQEKTESTVSKTSNSTIVADSHYDFTLNCPILGYDSVEWELSSGVGIYGDFEVTYPASGGDKIVSFGIMDQDNYAEFVDGHTASAYHVQENVGGYSFTFRIPHSDTWHFVFQNYALLTTKTVDLNLNTDTTPPAIDMNIDSYATYSGVKEITVTITEEIFSIDEVKLYIDDVLVDTETDGSFSYSWDTTEYDNGQHAVRITASDTVGNTGYDLAIVTVSNSIIPVLTEDPVLFLGFIGVGLVAFIAVAVVYTRKRGSDATQVPSQGVTTMSQKTAESQPVATPSPGRFCSSCGAPRSSSDARFCASCGAEFKDT